MDTNATETAPEAAAGTELTPDPDTLSESATVPASDVSADDAGTPDPDGKGRAAREAAKYRTQLRETETRLSEVTARLESMQLELARDVAVRAGLAHGAEFNVPVTEFTDPATGLVDTAKVGQLTADLLRGKPYLKRRTSWDDARPLPESAMDHDSKSWSSFLSR